MTSKQTLLLAGISLAIFKSRLNAQSSADVPWEHVCQAAHGQTMRVTTNTGDAFDGFCVSVNVDQVSVKTINQRVVQIARSTVSRIAIPREHRLTSLGKGMRQALQTGFHLLLSPLAPVGLVAIPGTLAWGAVAVPFCAAGDLVSGRKELVLRTH